MTKAIYIPEEGKGSFHEGFPRQNPEGEEGEAGEGTSEGMRFSCKEWWFWGKLKLRLKPRSSFSAILTFPLSFPQNKAPETLLKLA